MPRKAQQLHYARDSACYARVDCKEVRTVEDGKNYAAGEEKCDGVFEQYGDEKSERERK